MSVHDLTFSAWDSYTDGYGTPFGLDWSSDTAMKGRFAYPYIEALRQAINERAEPFGFRLAPSNGLNSKQYGWRVLWSAIGLCQGGWIVPTHRWMSGAWSALSTSPNRYTLPATWVDPVLLPSINDLRGFGAIVDGEEAYEGVHLATLYPMTYVDVSVHFPGSGWSTEQFRNRLMDAAGVTDVAFRAWFLTDVTWGYTGTRSPLVLVPLASLAYNLKLMVSQLTCCVVAPSLAETSHMFRYLKWNSIHTFPSWAVYIATFNALPWSADVPESLSQSPFIMSIAGDAAGGTNFDSDSDLYYVVCRTYSDLTYTYTGKARSTERAVGLFLSNDVYNMGRPYFQSQDFPTITGVETGGIEIPNWLVYATVSSGSVEAGGDSVAVRVGEFGDYNLVNAEPSLLQSGWMAYPTSWGLERWDFEVPSGFIFQ